MTDFFDKMSCKFKTNHPLCEVCCTKEQLLIETRSDEVSIEIASLMKQLALFGRLSVESPTINFGNNTYFENSSSNLQQPNSNHENNTNVEESKEDRQNTLTACKQPLLPPHPNRPHLRRVPQAPQRHISSRLQHPPHQRPN